MFLVYVMRFLFLFYCLCPLLSFSWLMFLPVSSYGPPTAPLMKVREERQEKEEVREETQETQPITRRTKHLH